MQSKNLYKKPVENGQDIYDLCIQEYGSIEAIFLLLQDNPQLNLEDRLTLGLKVQFRVLLPEEVTINKTMMDFFRANTIRVNNKETAIYVDGFTLTTNDGQVLVSDNDQQIGGFTAPVRSTPPIGITSSSNQILMTNDNRLIQ